MQIRSKVAVTLTKRNGFPAWWPITQLMQSVSPSQFQAIEIDWLSSSDGLSRAEAGLIDALKEFRRTGQDGRLRTALTARQSANDRMRTLMHAIWWESNLISGQRPSHARYASN